jgi:tetratricopeptide (TPR) repeat protein
MKDALWNAEAGVRNIGKSHQYVRLGNVLTEMGKIDLALECYQEALIREPDHCHALWNCASIELQQQKFQLALEHLRTLLVIEPSYKQGEASLQYGKLLYKLARWSLAKAHLEKDVKQWGHSESFLLLAKISLDGDRNETVAREYLETMLARLKASPKYNYRRNQHLMREAEKILRTLIASKI